MTKSPPTTAIEILKEYFGWAYKAGAQDRGDLPELRRQALAELESLVNEKVIGENENHIIVDNGVALDKCDAYKTGKEQDCNCPAGERNALRTQQRTALKAIFNVTKEN